MQSPQASRGEGGNGVAQGCGVVLAIILAVFMIARCSSDAPDVSDATGNATRAAVSEPASVSARSLNCRRGPDPAAVVAEGLSRGDEVIVAERRGEWAKLTRVRGDCWVSAAFLAEKTPVDGAAAVGEAGSSNAQGLTSAGAASTAAAAGAGYIAGKAVKTSRKRAGSKRRGASRGRRGSGGGGYYGSGCPCSGSQVCIGPRGGRYCITSGGNKRYGV